MNYIDLNFCIDKSDKSNRYFLLSYLQLNEFATNLEIDSFIFQQISRSLILIYTIFSFHVIFVEKNQIKGEVPFNTVVNPA